MTETLRLDPETDWVREAVAGSEDAFCRLVRLHQGRVRTLLGRYVSRPDVVDDLAQEVFLTAYHALPTWKGEAPLAVWFLGVARHRVLRHLRDEARRRVRETVTRRVLPALVAGPDGEPSSAEAFERERAALEACLESLPSESSDIVREHYFRGSTLASLAGRTGRKEGALRVALLRIRGALRRCMQGRLAAEGA